MLIALAVRSLIPLGFMLAPAGSDGQSFAIVICTANGLQQTLVDQDGNPAPAHKKPSTHDVCPFAAASLLALTPDLIEDELGVSFSTIAYALEDFALGKPSRPGSRSARGPPSILT